MWDLVVLLVTFRKKAHSLLCSCSLKFVSHWNIPMVSTSRLEHRRGVLLLQDPRPPGPGRLGLPHLVLDEALPPLAWLATTPGHQPRHHRGFGLRVGSELFLTLRPLHFLVFSQFQIRVLSSLPCTFFLCFCPSCLSSQLYHFHR